jgi:hypothetical protein
MGTKHQVSELTGEKLEAAFYQAVFEGDDPAIRVIEDPNATPGMRFYATRDIEAFDGQHGSTAMEAKQRLVVYEASGDVVELPE